MRYKVCAVRDRAVATYGQPFFVAAIGAAVRSFGDEVKRAGSPFNAHPEDFDLFYLGEYDDQTGEFDGIRPEQVAVGKDYI